MAIMFPSREDLSDIPYSELRVYDLLSSLGEGFIVFHSVQWVKRGSKWKSTWKENDFLILNKRLGGLVLEVKGGDIECHGGVFHQVNTNSGEIHYLSSDKKNDPLSQAIDGIYHYRKLLDRIIPNLSDRFPIEAAVWFSTCRVRDKLASFPLKYREIYGALLGDEDFEQKAHAIYNVFDFYSNEDKTSITDSEFERIIDSIASDFELITAPGVKKGELDRAFLKLTNEQAGLLDYISEQRTATIQGVAGTGKTLIAKEAAKRFGSEGRRVLFLCFNRFLFLHLKKTFPYKNVQYFNIHSFLSQYFPGEDTSSSEKRVAVLQRIDWDLLPYDDIIIDEAQDFLNNEILYFKDFAELKNGHFYAFYDKNQLATTKDIPSWIKDSECRLLLTKNCRNTYEIAITSYSVIDIALDKQILMINGEQTTISFVKGAPIPSLTRLIKLLTDDTNGYEPSDIVILSLKTEFNSILSNTKKLFGIPVTHEKSNDSILFTTASKFKGLESRVVIIIDIDESCFLNEDTKRLFYIACSRATQRLSLFVNGNDDTIESIANAINNSSHFAAKGRIAMKTQAKILSLDN